MDFDMNDGIARVTVRLIRLDPFERIMLRRELIAAMKSNRQGWEKLLTIMEKAKHKSPDLTMLQTREICQFTLDLLDNIDNRKATSNGKDDTA